MSSGGGAAPRSKPATRGEAPVLAGRNARATVAVKDLDRAKEFYHGTLGLPQVGAEGSEAVVYGTGSSTLLVYRSAHAGTNRATAVTWSVGEDVERVVQGLTAAGVAFEHYDLPGMTRRGDVHEAGGLQAAWFKDPDGNIHAIVSG